MRGVVLVLAFVLVAGLTTLPRAGLVAECRAVPPLGRAALFALRRGCPSELAGRLDYSRDGRIAKDRAADARYERAVKG